MLIPTIPAHRGASSGDGPEGGAGSGSPPPWFVTTAAGAAGSPGRRLRAFDGKRPGARNAAVERREAKRPDRKGRWTPRERPGVRKRTPQRCLASTERRLGAPLPLAWPRGVLQRYGAPGAAKQTGGEALASTLLASRMDDEGEIEC